MRALLDVNMLVALFDRDHHFYKRAHQWWAENQGRGWASCPLTENGVVRIISNPRYSKLLSAKAVEVVEGLRLFIEQTNHEFWPDTISFRDKKIFAIDRVLNPGQLTDAYLLGLATEHGARLVTFDQNIATSIVKNAKSRNLCVI
jgi:toxin-antitoxin system PIN domain toxin